MKKMIKRTPKKLLKNTQNNNAKKKTKLIKIREEINKH